MRAREHRQVRGRGSSSLGRYDEVKGPRVTEHRQVRSAGHGAQAGAPPAVPRLASARRARPALGHFRRRADGGGGGSGGARPFKSRAPEVVTRRRRGRKWTRPAAAGGRLGAAWGRQRGGAGSAGPARPRVPMGGGGPGR